MNQLRGLQLHPLGKEDQCISPFMQSSQEGEFFASGEPSTKKTLCTSLILSISMSSYARTSQHSRYESRKSSSWPLLNRAHTSLLNSLCFLFSFLWYGKASQIHSPNIPLKNDSYREQPRHPCCLSLMICIIGVRQKTSNACLRCDDTAQQTIH